MENLIQEITAEKLRDLINSEDRPYLIDIREDYEYEDGHMEDAHIPMEDLISRMDEIPNDRMVVIYCNSGKRSAPMCWVLSKDHGFTNIFSLVGGYEGFQEAVA